MTRRIKGEDARRRRRWPKSSVLVVTEDAARTSCSDGLSRSLAQEAKACAKTIPRHAWPTVCSGPSRLNQQGSARRASSREPMRGRWPASWREPTATRRRAGLRSRDKIRAALVAAGHSRPRRSRNHSVHRSRRASFGWYGVGEMLCDDARLENNRTTSGQVGGRWQSFGDHGAIRFRPPVKRTGSDRSRFGAIQIPGQMII